MTSPETTILRQRLARMIAHRANDSADVSAVVEAAVSTYHDLTAVLAPLISSAGVEALSGRAFDLARREYEADGGNDDLFLDGSFAVIEVSDTGEGISPQFLPFVFERRAQATERRFAGLGLGLAIVNHIVELHRGSVTVASEGEGKGATFTVRLPCAP